MPKCKICGGPHYQYQCFQNPKRKAAMKRKFSEYKAGKVPKRDKVLSKTRGLNRKRLILELDKYCSLYVRVSSTTNIRPTVQPHIRVCSNPTLGIGACYTCGKRLPWKALHNGHFKSRQFIGTRFDFDNMRPQCEYCNVVLHGNINKYREKLIKEIGEERVLALDKKKSKKLSTVELEQLLEEVKLKYKQLLEAKKNDQNTL